MDGSDCGEEAAEWFTKYLGIEAKLLYFDINRTRRPTEDPEGVEYNRSARPKPEQAVVSSYLSSWV